jgi:hypothetical protein
MTKNYAIVKDGKVVNVVLWDGKTKWSGSKTAVEITGNAGIGWDYSDGVFTDNRPAVEISE